MSSYSSNRDSTLSTAFTFYDSDDEGSALSTCTGDMFFDLSSVISTSMDSDDSDQMYNHQTMHEAFIRNSTASQRAENRTQVKHTQFFSRIKLDHNDDDDDEEIRDNKMSSASKPKSIFRRLSEYSQKIGGKSNKTDIGQRKTRDTAKVCSSSHKTTTILDTVSGISDSDVSEIDLMFGNYCSMSNETTPTSSSRVVKTTQKSHTHERVPVPLREMPSAQLSGNLLPPIRKQFKQPDTKFLNKSIGNHDCIGTEINTKAKVSLHNGEQMNLGERNRRRSHISIKNSDKNDFLKKKSDCFNNDQTLVSDWFPPSGKRNQVVVGGRKTSLNRNNGPYSNRRNSGYLPMINLQRKSVDYIRSQCHTRTSSVSNTVFPRFKTSI